MPLLPRPDEKLMIFIDGSNLFRQSKKYANDNNTDCNIDLIKLREKLVQDYNLIRAYYYFSIPVLKKEEDEIQEDMNEDEIQRIKQRREKIQNQINTQIKLKHFLEYNGFDVACFPLRTREKIIHCPVCEKDSSIEIWAEKGVDVALVTEMMFQSASNRCDVVIIVAGDLDYSEAIRRIKQRGIKVKIAFFKSLTSPDFIRCADEFIDIEEFLSEIQRK